MSWNTIESDAGVFTQLVKDLGVEGVQFEDVPFFDALAENPKSLYGVIFLFKYDPLNYSKDAPVQGTYDFDYPNSLFFAKQTIQNACGTQAVLNMLLSIHSDHRDIRLGETLTNFLEFTSSFQDPDLRGETISNSEQIRNVHNSFTCPDPFIQESLGDDKGTEQEEVFHFVSFIQHNGYIYELDGLQPVPIIHQAFGNDNNNSENFARNLISLLQQRIQKMSGVNGKFSVISIVRDRIEYLNEQLQLDDSNQYEYQGLLNYELDKREAWTKELAMRRQNLYGLVFEILKQVTSTMSEDEFDERISMAQQTTFKRIQDKYQKRG